MTEPLRDDDPAGQQDPVRVIGHVKWFDIVKGFGFIVPESAEVPIGEDVLLHISVLREYGENCADEGARIVCGAVRKERVGRRSISLKWTGPAGLWRRNQARRKSLSQ